MWDSGGQISGKRMKGGGAPGSCQIYVARLLLYFFLIVGKRMKGGGVLGSCQIYEE